MTNPEDECPAPLHAGPGGSPVPADLRLYAERVLAGTDLTTEQATSIARTGPARPEASPLIEALRAGWQASTADPRPGLLTDDQLDQPPHQEGPHQR